MHGCIAKQVKENLKWNFKSWIILIWKFSVKHFLYMWLINYYNTPTNLNILDSRDDLFGSNVFFSSGKALDIKNWIYIFKILNYVCVHTHTHLENQIG